MAVLPFASVIGYISCMYISPHLSHHSVSYDESVVVADHFDRQWSFLEENPVTDLEDSRLRRLRKKICGYEIHLVPGHWRLQAPAWTSSPNDAAGYAAYKRDHYVQHYHIMSKYHNEEPLGIEWLKPAFVSAVSSESFSQLLQRDRIYNLTAPSTFMPLALEPMIGAKPRPVSVISRFHGLPGTPVTEQQLSKVISHLDNVEYTVGPPDGRPNQLASELKGPMTSHRSFDLDITGLDSLAQRGYVESEFLYQGTSPSFLDFFRSEEEFKAARPLWQKVKEPNPRRDFSNLAPLCYFVEFPAKFSGPVEKESALHEMATVRWRWQPEQRVASWDVNATATLRGHSLNKEVDKFLETLRRSGVETAGPVAVAIATQNPFFRALGIRKPRLIVPVSSIDIAKFAAADKADLQAKVTNDAKSTEEEKGNES
jgi:hypothetical protein